MERPNVDFGSRFLQKLATQNVESGVKVWRHDTLPIDNHPNYTQLTNLSILSTLTLSTMAPSIMTLIITTLSIVILNILTLSIMTLSITTLSILALIITTIDMNDTQHQ
jgi:hypothetical protein